MKQQIHLMAGIVHMLTQKYSHEQVYQLLNKLSGAIGKELTDKEQVEMLNDRCDKWIENPDCFK